ncbi:MAG: hypothetical protein OQJ89_11160 [Kangiellaceae bacterium]|nr:hypothetical protein [Kangiellaceae bacterium]MCW9000279.1 hypothetical protein [Kangiellaceae bacterium]MCW9017516.1 hypothetical protein [Kangiellaceae bacterium]
MNKKIHLSLILCLFSPLASAICVNKSALDVDGMESELSLYVKETSLESLLKNGFKEVSCNGIKEPNLEDAKAKCNSMKAMPEKLKNNVFETFNITVDDICRVSLEYLES